MSKTKIILFCLLFIVCIFCGCDDATTTNSESENAEKTNIIKTEYFSMTVPQTWKNSYKYRYRDSSEENDINIHVSMFSKNEFSEAHLFTIYFLSLDDKENIEIALDDFIKPIAIISKDGVETHLIGYMLASEMACTKEEEEKFLQMINDVPQIVSTIRAEEGYILDLWNDAMREKILTEYYKTPYAPVSFDILDASFKGYSNLTGATFFEKTSQNALAPYYIKKLDTVTYLYGTNKTLIGVKDDNIYFLTYFDSNSVREAIVKLEVNELFEIEPAVLEVNNSYNSRYFFYWKIENGYIGFVTIGGENPTDSYNYSVNNIIFFKDLSIINSVIN